MSKYHIVGGGDGWSDPVYADEYGNIVSKETVERERQLEEVKRQILSELKKGE